MFSSLLTPIDLAHVERSEKALQVCGDLAKRYEAEVVLLTVAGWSIRADEVDMEKEQERFRDIVDEASRKAGLPIRGAFRAGDVVSVAVREAVMEFQVDLVVMSSHEPELADYLLGSNAASVALHTPCSVMVVR